MPGYTKLFSSIVGSTIWREKPETKVVWITMLAMADKHGEVSCSVPGLADLARVKIEDCEAALKTFLSPDPYSRTKDADGRRIVEIDGGWALVNYAKYREMADHEDQKRKTAERVRRFRENHRPAAGVCNAKCNALLTKSNDKATPDTDTTLNTESGVVSPKDDLTTELNIIPPSPPPPKPVTPKPLPQQPKPEPSGFLPGLKTAGASAASKAKPPKAGKGNSNPYPALNPATLELDNALPRVNAWAVWIDIRRDYKYPDPAVDPKDLQVAKVLSASIPTRQELECILNSFISDTDDPWLNQVAQHPADRQLRLLSSRLSHYRRRVQKLKDPQSGLFPPKTYGKFMTSASSRNTPPARTVPSPEAQTPQPVKDHVSAPDIATAPQNAKEGHISNQPMPKTNPNELTPPDDGDYHPLPDNWESLVPAGTDPADFILHWHESQT